MSIQIFCPKCKTSSALDAKVCGKCQKPFDRTRKYRVQVSVKGQRYNPRGGQPHHCQGA